MRSSIVVLLCALSLALAFESKPINQPEILSTTNKFIVPEILTTPVDHFSPQDNRTADFIYYGNNEYCHDGFPIYIFINDIGKYSLEWIQQGLMHDIARFHFGCLYTMHPRYFIDNVPVDDLSWDNLQYLTVEQILADYALLAGNLRHKHGAPRVIVWGTGIGATFATWLRLKYPHLIDGVWSSSGIFEIDYVTYNYYNSFEIPILESGSQACHARVLEVFSEIEHLVEISDNDALVSRLNLCNPIVFGSHEDVGALFEKLYDYITVFFDENHFNGVQTFCRDISVGASALDAFARWYNFVFALDNICIDHSYETQVNLHSNPSVYPGARRAWHYLQCTQVGNFKITEPLSWVPNHVQFAYHHSLCNDILGPNYDVFRLMETAKELAIEYGGLHQVVSNAIYVNGKHDPWYFDAITSSNDSSVTVFNIDSYVKSADLSSINGWETNQLSQVKQRITDIINTWSRP